MIKYKITYKPFNKPLILSQLENWLAETIFQYNKD
jgi:hypothetical protein